MLTKSKYISSESYTMLMVDIALFTVVDILLIVIIVRDFRISHKYSNKYMFRYNKILSTRLKFYAILLICLLTRNIWYL